MTKIRMSGLLILASMLFMPFLHAQELEHTAASLGLGSDLPINPNVTIGTLENGMTYYIMYNSRPENRAALRLAVNVGSILETDEQQGLAHFVEHMCFNGTKHFEKNQLVEYLESIGMRFGADLNAYTSFDETVYMLELPLDDETVIKRGMQVLVDWAHFVTFDHEEIDKERDVILEEWRTRKGAGSRILDKQFPILFKGSKYAERLPIGKPEIITGFEYETLIDFYRTWYRPDLMAIIAVGDFNVSEMEQRIIDLFSQIPAPETTIERPIAEVPDHDELLFTIVTDPEATSTSISLYFKHERKIDRRVSDYRKSMAERLYNRMLNDRYGELLQKADPPFISASSRKGSFVRSKEMYSLSAVTKDDEIERGFEALLSEAKRVQQHGFTATELERAKTNVLRRMEQSYNERDKTRSERHTSDLTRHFLSEAPIPGIEIEYELYKKYLPTISLREVNRLANEFMTERNRVVSLSMPEKEGVEVPTEEQLLAVLERVEKLELEPYVDEVADKPLIEITPMGASLASEIEHATIDVTEWQLSNGIRVLYKKTDFKADEVLFGATSPGGISLVDDEHIPSARMASNIVSVGGVGEFDAIQLRKALTGKVANVSPTISNDAEGFSGNASPKDLETAFQLMYLYFTSPRKDTSAFESFKTRMSAMFENMRNMPESVFNDTLQVTLANYHPRAKPMNKEWLEAIDLEKAFEIYTDRFSDASDFTFFFIGNIDEEELRTLVETWLGSLPVTNRNETWRDNELRRPEGVVKKEVYKGIDDKTMAAVVFSGPFEWNYENRYNFSALEEYLTILLRERIREEKGGTYGVGVHSQAVKIPREEYIFAISFGTSPERLDEMIDELFSVLEEAKNSLPSEEDVNKIKEIQRREREKNLKENNFWLGQLMNAVRLEEPLDQFLRYEKMIDGLTAEAIRDAARKYLDMENYIQVVLLPEEKGDE